MRKWTDDNARAQVAVARYNSISIVLVALIVGAVFLGGIKGCTDYSIEKVKHPVKYEQIDTYERGGNQ